MKKVVKSTAKAAVTAVDASAPPPAKVITNTAAHRAYWRHACLRIQHIHEEISAGKYPNRLTISDHFECDGRTVTRDITYMRDQMGLPLEFDRNRKGFYYTEPVRELPRPRLTTGEMLTMFIARRSLERYKGTSFAAEIAASFKRYASEFSTEVDFSWEELDRGISFRTCRLESAEDLEISRGNSRRDPRR